jgi:Cof subfamily protein (haloacid dehalogenase superfamily)
MTYRVIALDLDGTLLDRQKRILPESLAALADARAAGVKVVIATGRHHVAIKSFHHELGLDTAAICCNGTYLYDFKDKKVISSDPLDKAKAKKVVDLLEFYGIHGLLYVDDAMLYQQPNGPVQPSFRSTACATPPTKRTPCGNSPPRTTTSMRCTPLRSRPSKSLGWPVNGHGTTRLTSPRAATAKDVVCRSG